MDTLLLVFGAACGALVLPVLWWAVSGERRGAAGHLLVGTGGVSDLRAAVLAHGGHERAVGPALERLAGVGRRFTPAGMVQALEHRRSLAGSPPGWTIERLLIAKVVLGGGGGALGVARFLASPSIGNLVYAVAMLAGGYLAPDLLIRRRARERQAQIQRELPDTLDQITISVEAGLGFEAAVARVSKTGKGPLAEELSRTVQDVRTGMTRSEAMRRLSQRTDVAELRHFVIAFVQADSFGLPISQILRVQSTELRLKRRQNAEERAQKIPLKVVFPLLTCILPTLLIVVLGPGAIRAIETFAGR
ncbi:MAG: type II secretion system F family protein [Actinobacteria bacterium]|nr:type II secretion system F family protein [Actinomycetota bacterium]